MITYDFKTRACTGLCPHRRQPRPTESPRSAFRDRTKARYDVLSMVNSTFVNGDERNTELSTLTVLVQGCDDFELLSRFLHAPSKLSLANDSPCRDATGWNCAVEPPKRLITDEARAAGRSFSHFTSSASFLPLTTPPSRARPAHAHARRRAWCATGGRTFKTHPRRSHSISDYRNVLRNGPPKIKNK